METPPRTRIARLEFGPIKELPSCCLFYKDELRFVDDFKKRNPGKTVPGWRDRNIIAVCATHPIIEVLEFKDKRIWYIGRDYGNTGLTEKEVTTVGKHNDALRSMYPEFHDEFVQENRKWCATISILDRLIMAHPAASIGDLMESARHHGMEDYKCTIDAVRNRRTAIHKACIRYEEERLREMLGLDRLKKNEVCCKLVHFGDDLAAILTETSSIDELFTAKAWKRWPLSMRLLTNTFTYGAEAVLNPGLKNVKIEWAIGEAGEISSAPGRGKVIATAKSFKRRT